MDKSTAAILAELLVFIIKILMFWWLWDAIIPQMFVGAPFIDGWAALGLITLVQCTTQYRSKRD